MKSVILVLSVFIFASSCADEAVLSDEDQMQKDIEIIDKWLDDNAIKALTDPSGLRYVIKITGTGAKPKIPNKISVTYVGKFLSDGVTPDKSVVFDKPTGAITFNLAQVIQGWQIGFQLLPKGSKATLYIPSSLAYGKGGAGTSIPADSNLFFDVELIDVK